MGMTLAIRAAMPSAGQVMRSARATKLPGITAPIAKTSTQEMWLLTTSCPRRLRIGPPDTLIRTPRQRSTARQ